MTDHTTLTAAEREALLRRTAHKMDFHATRDDVLFLLARVAEARADERERIAQAIEDDSHVAMSIRRPEPWQHATRRAARIAREGADR